MYYQKQINQFNKANSIISSISMIGEYQMGQQEITPMVDTNFQLCHQIKSIKNVKVGKKGDYKLLKQNVFNLLHSNLPHHRLRGFKKHQSIKGNNQDSTSQKRLKTGKKIMKKGMRCRRVGSQYSTSGGKSSSIIQQCENFDQNGTISKNHKICSRGINFEANLVKGSIGHSTLVFSEQITEGTYYLEFKIIPFYPLPGESQYTHKPQIRIGMCGPQHKLDTPLGVGKSIGLHLSKQKIITEGKSEHLIDVNPQIFKKGINFGDVIGLLLDFSPPHKQKNNCKLWEDSSITYFVNGALFGKYTNIKQMFYHPALSLYNGASLEFHIREQQMLYQPQGSLSYDKITQYINLYN